MQGTTEPVQRLEDAVRESMSAGLARLVATPYDSPLAPALGTCALVPAHGEEFSPRAKPYRRSHKGLRMRKIRVGRRSISAYRTVVALRYDTLDLGVVRHLCHERRCIRDTHLTAGSKKNNSDDNKALSDLRRATKGLRKDSRQHIFDAYARYAFQAHLENEIRYGNYDQKFSWLQRVDFDPGSYILRFIQQCPRHITEHDVLKENDMSTHMINTYKERAAGDLRAAADAIEAATSFDDADSIQAACAQARMGAKTANELVSLYRRERRKEERRARKEATKASN